MRTEEGFGFGKVEGCVDGRMGTCKCGKMGVWKKGEWKDGGVGNLECGKIGCVGIWECWKRMLRDFGQRKCGQMERWIEGGRTEVREVDV